MKLTTKMRPEVSGTVMNPNGSIDIFFKQERLLPINIEVSIFTPDTLTAIQKYLIEQHNDSRWEDECDDHDVA